MNKKISKRFLHCDNNSCENEIKKKQLFVIITN
jgi:hypothetical protein